MTMPLSSLALMAQESGGPQLGNPQSGNSETEFKQPNVQKKQHPLAPALEIAMESLKSLESVKDYQATFYKTELVRNRYVQHQALLKFRENPFSVYMGFEGPNKGREVLYVEGKNNGNLIAKESGVAGIVGGVSLSPDSSMAMSESRYPITDIGMKNLLTKLIAQWTMESKYGECNVKITNGSMQLAKDAPPVKCKVVDSKHPKVRKQFKYHHTRLVVNRDTELPMIVEQYAFPQADGQKPLLIGKYVYVNVKTDVGLNDSDFDANNRSYNFR